MRADGFVWDIVQQVDHGFHEKDECAFLLALMADDDEATALVFGVPHRLDKV